jgi:hypothetical protein
MMYSNMEFWKTFNDRLPCSTSRDTLLVATIVLLEGVGLVAGLQSQLFTVAPNESFTEARTKMGVLAVGVAGVEPSIDD